MYLRWAYPMEVLLYAQNERRTPVPPRMETCSAVRRLSNMRSFCLSNFFQSNRLSRDIRVYDRTHDSSPWLLREGCMS